MEFHKPDYKWYAIYCRINQEKKIAKLLQRDKIEFYLPLMKTLRQWSDRKVWVEEPFFRCYVFVRVSYIEFFDVLSTPGVVSYVMFNGRAQAIPDQQIQNIKKMIDQQEREVVLSRENIERGQNAEVIFGTFKGLTGEVIKVCNNYRIVIRIKALCCNLVANISKDEVKIVKPVGTSLRGTSKVLVSQSVPGY